MKIYMCGIDYQTELGEIPVEVYPSIEYLKEKRNCWEECGIVEIEINKDENVTWVYPMKLFRGQDE